MSLDVTGILDQVVSHALTLGLFERVNTAEPKSAPGNGLTCAIWADRIEPLALVSGLDSTSVRVVFMVRLYTSMTRQPTDEIDPNIMAAVDTLIGAYSGALTLGGKVRNVDLLGAHGVGLGAQAGYVNQDGKLFRVMTLTLPMVINDVWEQSP